MYESFILAVWNKLCTAKSSEVVNHEGKISEEEMGMETETGEKIENHHTEMQIMFCHPIVGNDSVLDQMQYMAPHIPNVHKSVTSAALVKISMLEPPTLTNGRVTFSKYRQERLSLSL